MGVQLTPLGPARVMLLCEVTTCLRSVAPLVLRRLMRLLCASIRDDAIPLHGAARPQVALSSLVALQVTLGESGKHHQGNGSIYAVPPAQVHFQACPA
jgi:hypothetical protein